MGYRKHIQKWCSNQFAQYEAYIMVKATKHNLLDTP